MKKTKNASYIKFYESDGTETCFWSHPRELEVQSLAQYHHRSNCLYNCSRLTDAVYDLQIGRKCNKHTLHSTEVAYENKSWFCSS